MNKWISVEERLPEPKTAVLVYIKYKKYSDRWFTYGLMCLSPQSKQWYHFWGDLNNMDIKTWNEEFKVTHWINVPENNL